MHLTSSQFTDGGVIPDQFTCKGAGGNPLLTVSGAPAGTQTLVLVMADPDAPGGTFDHWLAWNIPGSTEQIPENWAPGPAVSQGQNGAGKTGYTPPCPPSGTHHYEFRVYALDRRLNLAPSVRREELEATASKHALDQAQLIGIVSK